MSEAGVYVHVLYDFNYTDGGREVKIEKDEKLLLLKKSNVDWWQVIRCSENQPFYAPSSYLQIVGKKCLKGSKPCDVNANFQKTNDKGTNYNEGNLKSLFINDLSKTAPISASHVFLKQSCELSKSVPGPLSFNNPLCTDPKLKCDSNENHVSEELSKNNDVSTAKSPFKNSKLNASSHSDLSSPIYVNVSPQSLNRSPPIPTLANTPIRSLPNDWFEYAEESGRKYYFHMTSGKVTWKPPRRHETYQSSPVNSQQNSPKFDNSPIAVPKPPPKQLKPKLQKIGLGSCESLESPTSPCMFTILPQGWNQEMDLKSGLVYYLHESTKKKWFSSLDENGRTYFYDEDSTESLWELPDIVSDSQGSGKLEKKDNEEQNLLATQKPTDSNACNTSPASPKLRKKAPKLPVPRQFKTRSMVIPECVNLTSTDDNKGFLPPSFGEGYWPSVQDGHFSITRKGTLNKTKLVENGRRIRKNWTSSFVVLTDVFMLFYKDIRSAHLATPGIKPELCIDLNGAYIDWCPEKSSRKNVFQISTVLGGQLLLQDDNAQTTKEWFDTIQSAIMMLPSSLEQAESKYAISDRDDSLRRDVKLSRSKSTKQYSSSKSGNEDGNLSIPAEKKRKIRDKLRQFFVRRPTMESLREKGIILDEPVFGCQLENLCFRESNSIPKFVVKCIETIEKKELTADGLYRASGNLSQVQKIRIHVNQEDYSCLSEEEDVHVLTGALKMFFREMKEPLFPFHMFDGFMNAIALPDASSKLEALKELVYKLPEPNFETLKFLLEHLLRVTKFHKQNRMQVQNLAIVFGPTLMWPEQVSSNIALDMMHQNRIVEFLLLEFHNIFKA